LVVSKLGRDWQWANNGLRRWMWRDSISRKLNEREVKEQYQAAIKNRFSALENSDDNGDINTRRVWDAIRENIKIYVKESVGYCESKHHKLWFDECSKLVDSGTKLR
jgi:hypothetical protein